MAIRLTVTSPQIELVDISVTETSIAPHVADIVWQRAVIAERTYQLVAATNIWVDATPNNRFVYDVAEAVEDMLFDMNKSIYDSSIVLDDLIFAMAKEIIEVMIATDQLQYEITKPLEDIAGLIEVVGKATSKTFNDTYAETDNTTIQFGKGVLETVPVVETFSRVVSYSRAFADFVAVDDFSNIDKNWQGAKHNVASTSDYNTFVMGKGIQDSIATVDGQTIVVGKSLTESSIATDISSWSLEKDLGIDTANASDNITVSYVAGGIMVFNHVTFNQAAFG